MLLTILLAALAAAAAVATAVPPPPERSWSVRIGGAPRATPTVLGPAAIAVGFNSTGGGGAACIIVQDTGACVLGTKVVVPRHQAISQTVPLDAARAVFVVTGAESFLAVVSVHAGEQLRVAWPYATAPVEYTAQQALLFVPVGLKQLHNGSTVDTVRVFNMTDPAHGALYDIDLPRPAGAAAPLVRRVVAFQRAELALLVLHGGDLLLLNGTADGAPRAALRGVCGLTPRGALGLSQGALSDHGLPLVVVHGNVTAGNGTAGFALCAVEVDPVSFTLTVVWLMSYAGVAGVALWGGIDPLTPLLLKRQVGTAAPLRGLMLRGTVDWAAAPARPMAIVHRCSDGSRTAFVHDLAPADVANVPLQIPPLHANGSDVTALMQLKGQLSAVDPNAYPPLWQAPEGCATAPAFSPVKRLLVCSTPSALQAYSVDSAPGTVVWRDTVLQQQSVEYGAVQLNAYSAVTGTTFVAVAASGLLVFASVEATVPQPPVSPPAKGMSATVIVMIVLGVLAAGGLGGIGAFVLYRNSGVVDPRRHVLNSNDDMVEEVATEPRVAGYGALR